MDSFGVGQCEKHCIEHENFDDIFHVCCRNAHWFWSGIETLLLGGTCATVAFTIGYYVNGLLGDEVDAGVA